MSQVHKKDNKPYRELLISKRNCDFFEHFSSLFVFKMPKKVSTEEFIERAREKHGDMYNYENTVYTKAVNKIQIVCKIHGEFYQQPNNHLNGNGCPQCRIKKWSREKLNFILKEKYGDDCPVSVIGEYKTYEEKIEVITPWGNHMVFPQSLIQGQCPTIVSAMSKTAFFIKRAQSVHGDKYDYSLVEYTNIANKVKIICNIHGLFKQNPNCHVRGQGCPNCANKSKNKKLIEEDIIKRLIDLRTDYNYDLVKYRGIEKKIEIVCKHHGSFWQIPSNHFKGAGCPICANQKMGDARTMSLEEFLVKAKEVHGNRYTYSKTIYVKSIIKTIITCGIHGDFNQSPNSHLAGHGCRKCADINASKIQTDNPIGWTHTNWEIAAEKSKNFDSFKVYIIKCWNDEEEFYKIGKTFMSVENRFGWTSGTRIPYNYEVCQIFIYNSSKEASEKESLFKRCNKDRRYKPLINFPGMTECFNTIELKCLN